MCNSHYEAVKVKMHSVAESEGRLGQQERRPSHDVMSYVKALIKIKTKAPPEAAAWLPSTGGGKCLVCFPQPQHISRLVGRGPIVSPVLSFVALLTGAGRQRTHVRRFYVAGREQRGGVFSLNCPISVISCATYHVRPSG